LGIFSKYFFKSSKIYCDLKRCYIILLCKYMFKNSPKRFFFLHYWKSHIIMFNEFLKIFYSHWIHFKSYHMFPYYITSIFILKNWPLSTLKMNFDPKMWNTNYLLHLE
jgi:hypothetical protein